MGTKSVRETAAKTIPTALVILDGFGLTDAKNPGNAITPATAPHIFEFMKKYPSTTLDAHGEAVGLFPGQEGNSEAGHFNIGAGRVVKQDLLRITDAIKDGTFFKNTAFDEALFHAKKYHTRVHVVGLLTDGQSAHANPEHLYALLEYFRREQYGNIFLHLFTDGRDSAPHSAVDHLKALREHLLPNEQIASVCGRFYGMDRNKTWERTEAAYNAIVLGKATATAESAEKAISQGYNRGETDEYISPTVIVDAKGKPLVTVEDNDVVYFFNARSDRARQLTKAFVQPDFQKMNPGAFKRLSVPKHIRFVAMTDFGPDLPGILTAFPSPEVDNALAKAIGSAYRQLYISETEKYAHVTYFLNGGHAEPINGEVRELIPSGDVYSYADKPEMHSQELTDKIIAYLKAGTYDFICANYPNADMVGHTGNFDATCKAVTLLDGHINDLVSAYVAKKGQVIIVADHGNAEEMIDQKTGEMDTEHSIHPVPFIVIREDLKITLKPGKLCDVAPTVMKLMGLEKPKEMTGRVLF